MAIGQYILDEDGNPQLEPDLLKWALWLEHSSRRTGKDCRILARDYVGEIRIATDFLGLDFGALDGTPPLLWETMVFGGEYNYHQRRYTTRAEALAGHAEAVVLVKRSVRDLQELGHILAVSGGWEKK